MLGCCRGQAPLAGVFLLLPPLLLPRHGAGKDVCAEVLGVLLAGGRLLRQARVHAPLLARLPLLPALLCRARHASMDEVCDVDVLQL